MGWLGAEAAETTERPCAMHVNRDVYTYIYIYIYTKPKQRQQIVLLSPGESLRSQNNGNKSYFLALGNRFEAKTTATNRTS